MRRSITSIRSTGSKLVTFEDQSKRKKQPAPIYDNTKKQQSLDQHVTQSKSKYDHIRPTVNTKNSDDDVTISNASESDEDTQPTKPGVRTDIQPSPRKNLPASKPTEGINALVTKNVRPTTATTNGSTISALVKQPIVKAKRTTDKFSSDR